MIRVVGVVLENSRLLTPEAGALQIDWSAWESTIQRPGLVAAFKAAHQSVPVLKCESPYTAELESGFAKLVRLCVCHLGARKAQLSSLSVHICAKCKVTARPHAWASFMWARLRVHLLGTAQHRRSWMRPAAEENVRRRVVAQSTVAAMPLTPTYGQIAEADQAAIDSEKAIAELEEKLSTLSAASDWENMTLESEIAANPTIKREIAQDIENHKWFTI